MTRFELKRTCAVVIVIFVMAAIITVVAHEQITEKQEKAKTMINNGAEVYIDGIKVNPENIIIENYTIDFKNRKIILSAK